ncbi:hypothetical protein [Phaffia rhodozyma]|uniref:Thioredoxin-like fold n=1 Tax=Phaffia rhodozyma TaxID=264483 RepID=A0A0F7SF05_PHARH|nr:hypothetical protein [Phaffia rhodozyma]
MRFLRPQKLVPLLLLPLLASASAPIAAQDTSAVSAPPSKGIVVQAVDALADIVYSTIGLDLKGVKVKLAEEAVKAVENDKIEGMIRLTDENYDELVEFEDLTSEEEEDRVWCVLIHGAKTDSLSEMFWKAHLGAKNVSLGDPHELDRVKFARIDYLNVTSVLTRWNVWKPPYIVFVSDRGQTLRFLGPRSIRPEGELLREVLVNDDWKKAPVWESEWAPKGSRGEFMRSFGYYFAIWNTLASRIPRFGWVMLSGLVSQSILRFMHRNDPPAVPKKIVEPVAPAASDKAKAIADAVRKRASEKAKPEDDKSQPQPEGVRTRSAAARK